MNSLCPEASPPDNGYGFSFQNNGNYGYFFRCHNKFQLPSSAVNTSTCVNGKWEPEIPRACIPEGISCEPLLGATVTTDNCHLAGSPKDCRQPLPFGSEVTLTCREAYNGRQPTVHRCQSNGEWSPAPIRCNEICGQISSPLYMPWAVVVMHREKAWIFHKVGTIISHRIVVAFGRATEEMMQDLLVVVGRNAGHAGTQWPKVLKRVAISRPGDRNTSLYLYVTDKAIEFDLIRVAPICLDYSVFGNDPSTTVPIGKTGILTTFRVGVWAFELFDYKIIKNSECVSKDTGKNQYLQQQLASDKFCSHQAVGVDGQFCPYLTSGALAISENQGGKSTFYLRGVANEGHVIETHPNEVYCNRDEYQTFIDIKYFLPDIKRYIEEYKVI